MATSTNSYGWTAPQSQQYNSAQQQQFNNAQNSQLSQDKQFNNAQKASTASYTVPSYNPQGSNQYGNIQAQPYTYTPYQAPSISSSIPQYQYGNYGYGSPYSYSPYRPPAVNQTPTQAGNFTPGAQYNPPSNWTPAPVDFSTKENRDQNKSYAENFYFPSAQHMLNQQTQDFNQYANVRDFGETSLNNAFNRQIAANNSSREDAAFNFQQQQFGAEFGEAQRQYNISAGFQQQQINIDDMYKRGLISNEQYANESARIKIQNDLAIQQGQLGINRFEADTGRINAQTGQFSAETQRQEMINQNLIAQEQNRIDNMYKSGLITNEQYANETARLRTQAQNKVDLGRLGLDTRQQSLDERFRRYQLAQQTAISREQMANDLTMSRYSAFGRAQAPAASWAQNWG